MRDAFGEAVDVRRARRRRLVASVGVGLSVLAVSACGGSSSGSSEAKQSTAKDISASSGAELTKLLGYSGADPAKGKTLKVGAILALSGPESEHGKLMRNGLELAAKDIKAAGGPTLDINYQDQKGGDPQAAVNAGRKLGEEGYGFIASSYEFNFGALNPVFKRYKMMALDAGGGTGGLFNGNDFAWGFRAITPDDAFPGMFKYAAQAYPNAKRVAFTSWDLGGAFNNNLKSKLVASAKANGMQFVGSVLQKIGETDYSNTISKLRAMKPDVICACFSGADPGYFMKQYVNSGVKAPVLGIEYMPDAVKVAGPAYDGFKIVADIMDPKNPPNPLSKLFVDHYQQAYGKAPVSFYEANFYEMGLAVWELARRTAQSGGDVNSGVDLQKAMIANPTFKSLYGGDASTVGEISLDPKTHTPTSRPMSVIEVNGDNLKTLATFDIGGRDYTDVAK
ncbi:MAG TPA: ABC transporter substrate-binding protein [Baekduia sp.]|nr:ABC transporter substrate-binding protein [Baekduia sp.]